VAGVVVFLKGKLAERHPADGGRTPNPNAVKADEAGG